MLVRELNLLEVVNNIILVGDNLSASNGDKYPVPNGENWESYRYLYLMVWELYLMVWELYLMVR